jgi:TetR/AcrR family transcriptional repressor of nem operon
MPRAAAAPKKLLDAALRLVREKGYADASVDELCAAAGVTKGAFFHHFPSKEALAVAAARHWGEVTGALFASAPYHAPADPLERVLAYLRFRRELLAGEVPEFTCLLGTLVQEAHATSPAIRAACAEGIENHAATLEPDITAAMAERGVEGFSPMSLALHTQAVLQGAFILAKAQGGPAVAADSVDHLIRYVELLFGVAKPREEDHDDRTAA